MIQYVTMPIEILSIENLNLQEKFILSLARSFNDGCFLSNKQIGELIGISKSRVSAIISKLSCEGYLNVKLEYKPNSKEVAKRTITFIQKVKEVVAAIKEVVTGGKNKAIKRESNQPTQTTHTYYRTKKESVFNRTYSHNWDLDELERIDRQHLEEKYRERCRDEICTKG